MTTRTILATTVYGVPSGNYDGSSLTGRVILSQLPTTIADAVVCKPLHLESRGLKGYCISKPV